MGISAGVAARELGVSSRTLGIWSDKGIIKSTRTVGGWRLFDAVDVAKLKKKLAHRSSAAGASTRG